MRKPAREIAVSQALRNVGEVDEQYFWMPIYEDVAVDDDWMSPQMRAEKEKMTFAVDRSIVMRSTRRICAGVPKWRGLPKKWH